MESDQILRMHWHWPDLAKDCYTSVFRKYATVMVLGYCQFFFLLNISGTIWCWPDLGWNCYTSVFIPSTNYVCGGLYCFCVHLFVCPLGFDFYAGLGWGGGGGGRGEGEAVSNKLCLFTFLVIGPFAYLKLQMNLHLKIWGSCWPQSFFFNCSYLSYCGPLSYR